MTITIDDTDTAGGPAISGLSDSECRSVQSALIESEERFRQMAEMTGEWLWEQDPGGHYIYCSVAVEQILGYRPEEVVGKHYTEFLTLQDKAEKLFYAGNEKPFYSLTNLYRHKDGHQVITESTGLPIITASGKLLKWRGVDRDITARKAAEQQIRDAQVKLAIARNEIDIARKIQATLSPPAPLATEHFVVAGRCLPADQVGGDYYDYFLRGEDRLDMVIADVSGHSIGPALFMVETRSAIRSNADDGETPAAKLAQLNRFLFEDLDRADFFITLFYLQYDRRGQTARYANAGHSPPLLYQSRKRACVQLDADGLIVGVNRQVDFEEKSQPIESGDVILLYTDGLIEAEDGRGEFFGIERVESLLLAHCRDEPSALIDVLLENLRQFCRTDAFRDDVTLMVFKHL